MATRKKAAPKAPKAPESLMNKPAPKAVVEVPEVVETPETPEVPEVVETPEVELPQLTGDEEMTQGTSEVTPPKKVADTKVKKLKVKNAKGVEFTVSGEYYNANKHKLEIVDA